MPEGNPTLAVLRSHDVRFYVASRLFSSTSMTLLRATILWQVFAITQSTFHLGLTGLVQFVPAVPLSLVAGSFADAYDRRRLIMLSQAGSLLFSAALALAGSPPPLSSLYPLVFSLAVAHSFESPAGASLLPTLVPRELFPTAVAFQASVRNVGWMSGPVLAGFVIEAHGVSAAYALACGLYAVSIVLVAFVTPRINVAERRAVSLEAIGEGLRFVRSRPAILSSISLDMFAVIFASVTALLPVYADQILRVGPRGYGLLSASLEIGTVATAFLLLALPPILRPGRALVFAVFVFGTATILFGLSHSFPLSVAALVVAGMADQVSQVTRATILQLSTPDALRGRVSGVNMVFIVSSNRLGEVESGFLAAVTSATFSVVFGGFACLGVLGLVAARVPELWRYRVGSDPG